MLYYFIFFFFLVVILKIGCMLPSFGETFDCIAIDVRMILKFKKSVIISNILKGCPSAVLIFKGLSIT